MTDMLLTIYSTKSHAQALYSEQRFLNAVLQTRLKKCLGFSIKQPSISIFSGFLPQKKHKIESTKTMEQNINREDRDNKIGKSQKNTKFL